MLCGYIRLSVVCLSLLYEDIENHYHLTIYEIFNPDSANLQAVGWGLLFACYFINVHSRAWSEGISLELLNVIVEFLRSRVVHLFQLFLSRAQHLQRERHGKQLCSRHLILMPLRQNCRPLFASGLSCSEWMHQAKKLFGRPWARVASIPVERGSPVAPPACPLARS